MAAIVVFAKAPVAGQVKTRLIPALSPVGAARLYSHMLEHTVREALAAELGPVLLSASPGPGHPALLPLIARYRLGASAQRGDDLGERMLLAMREGLAAGPACVLVGADCPGIVARYHRRAAAELASGADIVLGPTADGGYALIAARAPHPELFLGMRWSHSKVREQTARRAASLGLTLRCLRPVRDIDSARDLALVPREWRLSDRFAPIF